MRLKYYLRGVGIGIIVTTVIFMISISLHKNETKPQDTAVENDKSTTVSEAEKNAQKEDVIGTETEETDKDKMDLADTKTTDKTDVKQPDTDKSDSSKTDADNSDKKKPSENTAKDDTAKDNTTSEQKTSDKETKPKDDKTEKVRFEIKGGEFSDTVCQKLKSAGLIDDAAAFNAYLVQKDYDNLILPGVYDIPKDSTYEEIAALLTTKVE